MWWPRHPRSRSAVDTAPAARPVRKPSARHADASVAGRADGRPDGRADDRGFILLESIVAIVIITILMTALTTMFITTMHATTNQRGAQNAIRIATDEIDQARGLSYSGALAGRDKTSVLAQFGAAPAAVKAWLNTAGDQAFDTGAAVNAGKTLCVGGAVTGCAHLPTTPVTRTLSNTTYQVSYYEEWCYRNAADKTTADCITKSAQIGGVTYRQYLRVVTAISWADATCPSGTCSYLSSILLNGTAEPLFYFNDSPPPLPSVTGCAPPAIAVGDTFSAEDPTHPALPIVGAGGFCALTGGVPPFTWAGNNLPAGLAVTSDGTVIGSPTTAGTKTGGNFVITDAFIRPGTSNSFSWLVYPELKITGAADQNGVAGTAAKSLVLSATGGSGATYGWNAQGLPPGITGTASGTGKTTFTLGGTPTAVGTYPVTVTVNDSSVKRTTSVTFQWTVVEPLGLPATGQQVSRVGFPIDPVPLAVSGGSGHAAITLAPGNALPNGLTLTGDATSGYSVTGTPTATSPAKNVTFNVDDPDSGQKSTITINWTVVDKPVLTIPDQSISKGAASSVNMNSFVTGAIGSVTFAQSGNPMPNGLTLNPDGSVTGTAGNPKQAFPGIQVQVTDSTGASNTATFTWTVTK